MDFSRFENWFTLVTGVEKMGCNTWVYSGKLSHLKNFLLSLQINVCIYKLQVVLAKHKLVQKAS